VGKNWSEPISSSLPCASGHIEIVVNGYCVSPLYAARVSLLEQQNSGGLSVKAYQHKIWIFLFVAAASYVFPRLVLSQAAPGSEKPAAQNSVADGQHDFDFEIGTWKIHLKKLVHPLTGSTTWVEFDGTSVTRKAWEGRADMEEFETDGAAGQIEGMTVRLYNPQSHQWSLYWANAKDGTFLTPLIGGFKDGRGEFYDQEFYKGKSIYNRFIWSEITPNSAHFEQSFSTDGGKTWETNWITDQTRVKP
jgi:hypothetical protein